MILAVFFMDKINGFMALLNSGMFNRSQGDLLHGICGDCEKEAEQQENGEE